MLDETIIDVHGRITVDGRSRHHDVRRENRKGILRIKRVFLMHNII